MAAKSIPIVDLENLYNWNHVSIEDKRCQEIAKTFGKALHDYGFAYLKNHGIPKELINDAFIQSKRFFESSPEIKASCAKTDITKNYHGYNKPGNEQLDTKSLEIREAYDITGTARFYPESLPEFQDKLEGLEAACIELDKKLLIVLAVALNLQDTHFFVKQMPQLQDRSIPNEDTLRTLYYPPVPPDVQPGAVRCAEHTDYGTFTLLFQDDIGGLEVRGGGTNDWLEATPIPDTIVVNVGDLLELWTCGYFPSTEHRVRTPSEDIRRENIRQSIAFFLHPASDVIVDALSIPGVTTNTSRYEGPVSTFQHILNKKKVTYGVEI